MQLAARPSVSHSGRLVRLAGRLNPPHDGLSSLTVVPRKHAAGVGSSGHRVVIVQVPPFPVLSVQIGAGWVATRMPLLL